MINRDNTGNPDRLVVCPTNVYLIRIQGHVKYMNIDMYTQEASKGPGNRFYVNRGKGVGGLSIGAKRCTILAQKIMFLPESHWY